MLILAYDLGTGGCKASLYNEQGHALASSFVAYNTYYPAANQHEQRPDDWWNAIVDSTQKLLASSKADPNSIHSIALSGQSLAVIPLDDKSQLLRDQIPIWSDTRPAKQVREFFDKVDLDHWYMTTGNGFSSETYSVFKIMWYRDHEPEMFSRIDKIVGSKDYINFRLTGEIATDHSYASGSGIYNLKQRHYDSEFLTASGLPADIFPHIVESTTLIGTLTPEAAEELGLSQRVEVYCGGVDNSCMALGAGNIREGAVYLSLGSSAWIAVSSTSPVVDLTVKPFVFAHVIPQMYTSATSIFSAGSSFRWLRDTVCSKLKDEADKQNLDPYDLMVEAAMRSPVGANNIFFNPSLAGGSAAYPNPDIRGAFLGIELRHTQDDLIRAVLEGITFDLRIMYTKLSQLVRLEDSILMVGGGSNSPAWMQLFADVFNTRFVKANIGQDAASLGAAAVAAVGSGLWNDFLFVENIIEGQEVKEPDRANVEAYKSLLPVYQQTWEQLSHIAEIMKQTQQRT